MAYSELSVIARVDLMDRDAVRNGGQRLELLLLNNPADDPEVLVSSLTGEELGRLQQLYERFEIDLEYEFTAKLITGEAEIEEYPLYERFRRLIGAEVDLAQVTSKDRLLFIGSGPFPISPILFSQFTGASVDCFDVSEEACETSRRLVDKLELTDKISVYNQSGERGPVYGYDVIVIALLAKPKEGIANNIWHHSPQDVRVICRNSGGFRSAFYQGTDPYTFTQSRHFSLGGQHTAGTGDTISSLLLKVDRDPDKY